MHYFYIGKGNGARAEKRKDMIGNQYINARLDEVMTITGETEKMFIISCKSQYGTFEVRRSKKNIKHLIVSGWLTNINMF